MPRKGVRISLATCPHTKPYLINNDETWKSSRLLERVFSSFQRPCNGRIKTRFVKNYRD